jgi:hypothetical protein
MIQWLKELFCIHNYKMIEPGYDRCTKCNKGKLYQVDNDIWWS